MANTVDPDEMAHNEPSHLDLQCLQIQLLLCLVLYELRLQPMHKATNLLHVLYINITAITKASISLGCDNFGTSWRQRSGI